MHDHVSFAYKKNIILSHTTARGYVSLGVPPVQMGYLISNQVALARLSLFVLRYVVSATGDVGHVDMFARIRADLTRPLSSRSRLATSRIQASRRFALRFRV